ncbi:MAG: DNA-formamidopyrimidine glycosylase family protein [Candidatus Bipolaricaulota bacterium]|nr:DNA-formamidopyrimidine glycosylase family protein [Candidatus Bipolaricaulota bacterium]
MPELPDLETLKEALEGRILGREIVSARALRPGILKTTAPLLDAVNGRAFSVVARRGKYLILTLEPKLHIVAHLMLGGRFVLCKSKTKITKATGLQVTFADGEDLRLIENGTIKLVKVYIVTDPSKVSGIANAGVEPLSRAFTVQVLAEMARGRRCHVKKLLTDQRAIAGIGSAYADEILFAAGISPVRYVSTLSDDDLERLHEAIGHVLSKAMGEIRKRIGKSLFTDDIRDFLKVYRRTGEPCPVCGAKIAEIRYANTRTYYCPVCQQGGKEVPDRRAWLTR